VYLDKLEKSIEELDYFNIGGESNLLIIISNSLKSNRTSLSSLIPRLSICKSGDSFKYSKSKYELPLH